MNIDPKKMQAMMKQMGIKQEEIDALRVIIEKEDENIIIENPSVVKINMSGNESWQITGDARTEEKGISLEDINIVMEKAGVSESEAKKALEDAEGDLSEAILSLS
ncbi:MAG: nascent polypeptide-associated complex protein [Nanoarchaeota archaeon]